MGWLPTVLIFSGDISDPRIIMMVSLTSLMFFLGFFELFRSLKKMSYREFLSYLLFIGYIKIAFKYIFGNLHFSSIFRGKGVLFKNRKTDGD
ncbi:hypothetical protein PRV_00815 [Mycoplasma parvum str. Indiana]|uniref:Uncharacterized protein n=1 Tax=Mycoplasma parvum str. Indiana TaxID=1403316 RepID=U5NFD4_9MOLU|nr:hypothetical protein PRV_00815 [Mycoplasma parvum str. Indiana]